jgi:hypothetical protein
MGTGESWESRMITIRFPKRQWATAWRAMIEVAPVRLVAADPLYEVLPAHLELLDERGVSYEVVPQAPTQNDRRSLRHASGQLAPRTVAVRRQSLRAAQ